MQSQLILVPPIVSAVHGPADVISISPDECVMQGISSESGCDHGSAGKYACDGLTRHARSMPVQCAVGSASCT